MAPDPFVCRFHEDDGLSCGNETPHTHCPSCHLANPGTTATLCRHHAPVDDWSAENRVFCDLIHRGTPVPRLPPAEREVVVFEDVA